MPVHRSRVRRASADTASMDPDWRRTCSTLSFQGLPKAADAYKLARAFDDPKDRALVLERYSQLKEDPIHIIVLDVQRVKRRAERATGLANGKCYEIRCGDFAEMTKELADGSAEGEDDFAKGRAAVSKMKTTPVDAGASRLRTMRERAREARHAASCSPRSGGRTIRALSNSRRG